MRIFKKREPFFSFSEISAESLSDVECTLGAFSHVATCEEKFLNIFSDAEMYAIFQKAGLVEQLNRRGYRKLLIDIDRNDEQVFSLRLYHERIHHESLLMDFRLSERQYSPGGEIAAICPQCRRANIIVLEWLSASNPKGRFTARRPQLPGQKTPGLGVLGNLFDVMRRIGEGMQRDGFLEVPDHYHNAVFYSKQFRFIDPAQEGMLTALGRDMKGHSLADVAWGFATGAVMDMDTGMPVQYVPSEQVFPLSRAMRSYFDSKQYHDRVRRDADARRFFLDRRGMMRRRRELMRRSSADEL
ncbi:MAG: hypothetical protein JXA20_15305 [Spirochaetes bacterium]|nr:hypothetical protein [Spirochaetota bacterium]